MKTVKKLKSDLDEVEFHLAAETAPSRCISS
jgi:hypothetical protein